MSTDMTDDAARRSPRRAARAVPVRGPRRRAAGLARRARRRRRACRRAPTSSPRASRRRASTCCCPGTMRDEPAGRRRRGRDHPHRPARRLLRRRRSSTSDDEADPRLPGDGARDHRLPRSSRCRPTEFAERVRASGSRWPCTCWRACSSGMRQRQRACSAERERLLALGTLSAGLTHELNNPAAAAVRATDALRDRVAGMRHKLAHDRRRARSTGDAAAEAGRWLQEEFVKQVRHAPDAHRRWRPPTARTSSATGSTTTASPAAGTSRRSSWPAGSDVERPGRGARRGAATTTLEGAIRWLAYTVETESLLREIIDATTRISDLVGAAKQYSQMDRAPHQCDRRARGPRRHAGDVRAQAGEAAASRWSRTTTARCRRSRPTRPSSTRCGRTSSTTRSTPWTARAR